MVPPSPPHRIHEPNLTRFSLFFPEKRDLFLENSGLVDFGIPANPFEPPAYQLFFNCAYQAGCRGE
jgi:hypothetical protein